MSAEVVLFCGDIEFLSAEKLINAKFSIEPKLSVHGDWIMLGQIIQNLSGNALKYNEESGRQWCVIKEESREAILRRETPGRESLTVSQIGFLTDSIALIGPGSER